jgi:hypothetical protein
MFKNIERNTSTQFLANSNPTCMEKPLKAIKNLKYVFLLSIFAMFSDFRANNILTKTFFSIETSLRYPETLNGLIQTETKHLFRNELK